MTFSSRRSGRTKPVPVKFFLLAVALFAGVFIPSLLIVPFYTSKKNTSNSPIDEVEILENLTNTGIVLSDNNCTTLWRGPNCELGEPFYLDESTPPVVVPKAFTGEITMSKSWLSSLSGDIKIRLPEKTPAWRHIGKVDQELMELVPDTDMLTQKNFQRCAVVGSSGSLLSARQGRMIDLHDLILRFNAAPTQGLEDNVGSRTDLRLVNSKWAEVAREGESELLLWNMRAAGALDYYKERKKANRDEKFHIFTADWVNYVAQTAAQLSKTFVGEDAKVFDALVGEGYTPTSGFTGLLIAINICRDVTLYGMQISEAQGFPYHYHNQCPQPFGARDDAEWLMIKRMLDIGLLQFHEPCIPECREQSEACMSCRVRNPEFYSDDKIAAARAVWERTPLPDYCAHRVEVLKREKLHIVNGGSPFTKEERGVIFDELVARDKATFVAGSEKVTQRIGHSRTTNRQRIHEVPHSNHYRHTSG